MDYSQIGLARFMIYEYLRKRRYTFCDGYILIERLSVIRVMLHVFACAHI